MAALDRALQQMHEQLWDEEAGMVQLYGLHLVRETALGAFLDLEQGNLARAERALRRVVEFQYPVTSDPRWAGTFKTYSTQPDAGTQDNDGRVRDQQWRDFDPNWRQFLAVILWVTERLYGHVIPDDLRVAMLRAVHTAAHSEQADRISERYTNVALMHAWLCDVSRDTRSTDLAERIADQIRSDGDIAEYNSPTYDAISLLAGCLLADFATSTELRKLGEDVIGRVTDRLNVVWHPRFGVQAGPYSRAYGIDPQRYVSLISVLMTAIDVPAAGPTTLDNTTTHVHDLYFLPIFRRICGRLRDRIAPSRVAVARRHEQRFGEVIATSLIEPSAVIGWERGRRDRFAFDQYSPFAMFAEDGHIGVRTRADTKWVDVIEVAHHVYELRCERIVDHPANGDRASLTIVASHSPIMHENELLFGEITLQFPGIAVEVRLAR